MNSCVFKFLYLLFPLLTYFFLRISVKLFFILFVIVVIFPPKDVFCAFTAFWGIGASILLFIKAYTNRKNVFEKEILELENKKSKLLEKLDSLKGEIEIIRDSDKKNVILYTIFNLTSSMTSINSLSSLEKYINSYVDAKTSLFYLLNDEAVCIYGDNKRFDDVKKRTKNVLFITDRENDIFAMVIDSSNDSIINNAKELLYEISSSLKKLHLFELSDRLSMKDGLTGLYRRGVFNEKLEEEIVKAKNFKHSVGLMMIDIDHFKNINDTYGHQVGDEVLKAVAKIIKESVYETDFPARYGGEEFAVIMPRAQIEGSARKAEYIRQFICGQRIRTGIVDIKVSVSIGIAYYPFDALSASDLIHCADLALYHSKQNGRNRTTLYSEINRM